MADNNQIIELYTELAQNPQKDFGWEKGLENAKAHGYKQEWIDALPKELWEYCAAVGNPFLDAEINEGDIVVDLGCGAGVDVLVARLHVGESGRVYGVDITPKMVEKASEHANLAGFTNVEILESSFDNVPLEDESVDVVISNGAINLTSCKESVFAEIYRILKPEGKIYFADMIDISEPSSECCSLEQSSCCSASEGEEDWANCVAGTMRENELIELMQKAGFKDVACTGHTHYTTAETTRGAVFQATKIPANLKRKQHWDEIFRTKDYTQVLWHQNNPVKSLELIKKYATTESRIIDAGCGASFLADQLIAEGFKHITLLDTAQSSLDIVKQRLNNKDICYVCNDILEFTTDESYDIWHDRAVFHFLLSKKKRERYFQLLLKLLKPKAKAILSTFRTDGPLQCAGLDIMQYNHEKMCNELPIGLRLIESEKYDHQTPKETIQEYIYFVIEKI